MSDLNLLDASPASKAGLDLKLYPAHLVKYPTPPDIKKLHDFAHKAGKAGTV